MKVFKFGGASVKDTEGVKNVAKIMKRFSGENILVVVSAMGKTTNALERLVQSYFYKKGDSAAILEEIKQYHFDIIRQLFPDVVHPVYNEINNAFVELDWAVEGSPIKDYDFEYDQVVSVGEIISSKIVSAYLHESGIQNKWLDARDYVKTDNTYREGKVDWQFTEKLAKENPLFKLQIPKHSNTQTLITQGFIGVTSENYTTTLGREGSDYSAAIFAYIFDAESVTIWKDVPGVLNADPKWFKDTVMLDRISYRDAIELAYYGASVIHPKTIQPLQNKNIPLYVKSFLNPDSKGTIISADSNALPVPSFIFKVNQVLISILPKDFSFIIEENLSDIFSLFARQRIKINVMQNTAISFSVSVDNDPLKIPALIRALQEHYKVKYNENMELITIRHYDQETIDRVTEGKQIILELKSRNTVQLVCKQLTIDN